VTMNSPNDRYVNDGEIARPSRRMLARVGSSELARRDQGHVLPEDPFAQQSFYMLGWTPATYDSHNPLYAGWATRVKASGEFNLGALECEGR